LQLFRITQLIHDFVMGCGKHPGIQPDMIRRVTMPDANSWRDRAQQWRSMADGCEDPIIREQLLSLADDADAVATELYAESAEVGSEGVPAGGQG
jgi:hypothetical protein